MKRTGAGVLAISAILGVAAAAVLAILLWLRARSA